ncbi:sulfurtransferase [bacterium]|nr:sulfurtransferase [bacterium]
MELVDQNILNVAGYRFFKLSNPQEVRESLKTFSRELGVKGTVLLGPEGVNLMIAGTPEQIKIFQKHLHEELKFPLFEYKKSWSNRQPFSRMLVKVKPEIVTTGHEDINPADFTGSYLSPKELKKWLDEERDIVFLDTRNDYEVHLGKFSKAQDLEVKSFRDFLSKVGSFPEAIKKKPVVTYCTGGIRCEKATAIMLKKQGFEEVYQLEGGILKYFEDCGKEHWQGECFVFDRRVGVDPSLKETETLQCYACRSPIVKEDQKSEYYVPEKSCPYCKRMKKSDLVEDSIVQN